MTKQQTSGSYGTKSAPEEDRSASEAQNDAAVPKRRGAWTVFLVGLVHQSVVLLVALGVSWATTAGPLHLSISTTVMLIATVVVVIGLCAAPGVWVSKALGREFPGHILLGLLIALCAVTALAMTVVAREAGTDAALRERGVEAHATVVSVSEWRGVRSCTLRHPDGWEIGQVLRGDGCERYASAGDRIWVRYDAAGSVGTVRVGQESWASQGLVKGFAGAYALSGVVLSAFAARAYHRHRRASVPGTQL